VATYILLWLRLLMDLTVCILILIILQSNISVLQLDIPLHFCNKFKLVKGYVEFNLIYPIFWMLYLVEVKLQPTVSRQVCLGVGLPSGTHDQIFFCFENCGFLAVWRPLWSEDGSVVYSYSWFWALPEQSLLGPSPTELRPYFTVSFEGQIPLFISRRNRVTQLYPQALSSLFVASYDPQGYSGVILTHIYYGIVSSKPN
jgi:hypothetical protein